jgi:para-nitrobenzyl esterase
MSFKSKWRRAAFASVILASASMAQAGIDKPVKTAQGLVKGTAALKPGVTVFKGIPFAEAPVGKLRFMSAVPVKTSWKGVRDGSKWGDTCVQPPAPTRAMGVNQATDMPDSPKISEDCLNLAVWTGAKGAGEKRPVMVWFYGGAYSEGGNSMPFADGSKLAAKGAIIVAVNYRLGMFGFMSHPDASTLSGHNASGNQALSDGIAALKWVKANIAAFGGDPNNVTIFGQSAGACITAALTGSPQAKGLFAKAISESGAWSGLSPTVMGSRANAEKQTLAAMEKAGVKTFADLQALPADQVAKLGRGQGLIVDGWIVPEDQSKTFAEGRQNKVPVLVGSNKEDFGGGFGPAMTLERWKSSAAQRWGELAELGLSAYPATTDAEAAAANGRTGPEGMNWFMHHFANEQAKQGQAAYVYQFVHAPPVAEGVKSGGATHASELAYVFGNLEMPREVPDVSSPAIASKSAPDLKLADQMMSYWVNFARTGNPNGPGLPHWGSVKESKANEAMLLAANDKSAIGPAMSPDAAKLFDGLFQRNVMAKLK